MPKLGRRPSQFLKRRQTYEDVELKQLTYERELDYRNWTNWYRLLDTILFLPENIWWMTILCVMALLTITMESSNYVSVDQDILEVPISKLIDVGYNVMYAIHIIATILKDLYKILHEKQKYSWAYWLWFVSDGITYLHYLNLGNIEYLSQIKGVDCNYMIKFICYFLRLRRIVKFLRELNNYHLNNSILGTLMKYWYIIIMLRVLFSNINLWVGFDEVIYYTLVPKALNTKQGQLFVRSFYLINKRFLPIGSYATFDTNLSRLSMVCVSIIGSLFIKGLSISSMALIIKIYIEAEYMFRARFRSIIKVMEKINVPLPFRHKVKTFYRSYWNKQEAVSTTELLPTFPPGLINSVHTEIYFEALQRSLILRDLSYQFLAELAKRMKTIHYVPGDYIIKRDELKKYAVVFVNYGDVEVVTAEDDETPILRFTRGSILNPCGASVDVASTKAQVSVRATTFCTAHILHTADVWRVAVTHGHLKKPNRTMHAAWDEHFNKVVRHYAQRPHPPVKYKSTISRLKENLMELKQARDEKGKLLLRHSSVFLHLADSYIMRNHRDGLLIDESDPICVRTSFPCILQTSSDLQTLWKMIISLLTLIVTFVHPYYLVFTRVQTVNFVFFNFVVSLIFCLDLFIFLCTGAQIEEGVPITFVETASRQMRSFWFWVDVLAAAPIFENIGEGDWMVGMNKLFKLPQVFRTLKLLEDKSEYLSGTVRFLSFSLLMFVFSWLTAVTAQGFFCFRLGYCFHNGLTKPRFWTDNITYTNDDATENLVTTRLHWAISLVSFTSHTTASTSRGNFPTQALAIGLLECAVLLQIFVIAAYSAVIMATDQMKSQYDEFVQTVRGFLMKQNVIPVLRKRFINYLHLCWHTDKVYTMTHKKRSMFFDLPEHVYEDVFAAQRIKYILTIPFTSAIPDNILKSLSGATRHLYVSPNEILLNSGDITNEIYIIARGFCDVIDPDTKKTVSTLSAMKCFGDIECLLRLPAYYTVRAVTHIELYVISRRHLWKVINMKSIKNTIIYTKKHPLYLGLLRRRRKSFLSYEQPPPPPSRMMFPLLRKHIPDSAYLDPFYGLGFFSMLRYVFPRFTFHPDGPYLRWHEVFRGICAFASAIVMPLYYLFSMQYPIMKEIVWILDITAYFDVIQRMLVAYYNKKGILIYHPISTASYYIRRSFLVDVMACLPLEYLDNIKLTLFDDKNYVIVPPGMEFLLFNRCLQLYRLPAALWFLDKCIKRPEFLYGMKVLPIFLVLLTTTSSLVTTLSVSKINFKDAKWQLIPFPTANETHWVYQNVSKLEYNILESPFNLWLTTTYWATSRLTCTGFGLFREHTAGIMQIFIIGMFIAWLVSNYVAVRVLSICSNVSESQAHFQQNIKDIIDFMARENFPKKLKREVLSYYDYKWKNTGGVDYASMLSLCDHVTLRADVILHVYGRTFERCRLLRRCDKSLLRLLGRAVTSRYFYQNMMVIERSDCISTLYFVSRGAIYASDPEDDEQFTAMLTCGSMFGNLSENEEIVSSCRFIAGSNVHLLKINAVLFYKILVDFPDVRETLAKVRMKGENYLTGFQESSTTDFHSEFTVAEDAEQSTFMKYLHTHGSIFILYKIAVCLLCIFLDTYNAGFLDNRWFVILVLYALDLAFLFNVALELLFPYVSDQETDELVDLKVVKDRYISNDFKYDMLSMMPIELLCFCFNDQLLVFSMLRLNRLIRLVAYVKALDRWANQLTTDKNLINTFSRIVGFALFMHVNICFWVFLAEFEDHEERTSWRWRKTDTGQLETLCPDNIYICSMYFILSTFLKLGEKMILPRQDIEVIYICFLMLTSSVVYNVYLGQMINIEHYLTFRSLNFFGKFLELKKFLKINCPSQNLVTQTEKYTLYLWREARGLQLPFFVRKAPYCLQLKIMSAAYMNHLKENPIFQNCEPVFLRQLVGLLEPYYYDEFMYVVRAGEITNAMYFVHKGCVQERIDERRQQIGVYKPGTFFGGVHGIYRNVPYNYSYMAEIKSQVLTLSLDSWESLLTHFPGNIKHIYGNMKDPRKDTQFGKLPGKVRSFPPKAIRQTLMHQEAFKKTDQPFSLPHIYEAKVIRKKMPMSDNLKKGLKEIEDNMTKLEILREKERLLEKERVAIEKETSTEKETTTGTTQGGVMKKIKGMVSRLSDSWESPKVISPDMKIKFQGAKSPKATKGNEPLSGTTSAVAGSAVAGATVAGAAVAGAATARAAGATSAQPQPPAVSRLQRGSEMSFSDGTEKHHDFYVPETSQKTESNVDVELKSSGEDDLHKESKSHEHKEDSVNVPPSTSATNAEPESEVPDASKARYTRRKTVMAPNIEELNKVFNKVDEDKTADAVTAKPQLPPMLLSQLPRDSEKAFSDQEETEQQYDFYAPGTSQKMESKKEDSVYAPPSTSATNAESESEVPDASKARYARRKTVMAPNIEELNKVYKNVDEDKATDAVTAKPQLPPMLLSQLPRDSEKAFSDQEGTEQQHDFYAPGTSQKMESKKEDSVYAPPSTSATNAESESEVPDASKARYARRKTVMAPNIEELNKVYKNVDEDKATDAVTAKPQLPPMLLSQLPRDSEKAFSDQEGTEQQHDFYAPGTSQKIESKKEDSVYAPPSTESEVPDASKARYARRKTVMAPNIDELNKVFKKEDESMTNLKVLKTESLQKDQTLTSVLHDDSLKKETPLEEVKLGKQIARTSSESLILSRRMTSINVFDKNILQDKPPSKDLASFSKPPVEEIELKDLPPPSPFTIRDDPRRSTDILKELKKSDSVSSQLLAGDKLLISEGEDKNKESTRRKTVIGMNRDALNLLGDITKLRLSESSSDINVKKEENDSPKSGLDLASEKRKKAKDRQNKDMYQLHDKTPSKDLASSSKPPVEEIELKDLPPPSPSTLRDDHRKSTDSILKELKKSDSASSQLLVGDKLLLSEGEDKNKGSTRRKTVIGMNRDALNLLGDVTKMRLSESSSDINVKKEETDSPKSGLELASEKRKKAKDEKNKDKE